jgi:hypothetical protein
VVPAGLLVVMLLDVVESVVEVPLCVVVKVVVGGSV